MIKVFYKSMIIEFENLADVVAFVERFNPPDKIDTVFKDQIEKENNTDCCSERYYKNHTIYKSLDGNSYHVYGPGISAVTYKTLEMARSAIDLWEDSQKNIKVTKPGVPKRIDLQLFDDITLPEKKKRGRPKKVVDAAGLSEKGIPLTEDRFEDINGKEFVDGVCEKLAESIIEDSNKNKEDLIMTVDDVAKELSKTNMMLFPEEALRKIFQKAYKPALKTDVKATYPLTQLDPQMCSTFVSEVSNKLGIKCTLSYKVGKTGFTYVLIK